MSTEIFESIIDTNLPSAGTPLFSNSIFHPLDQLFSSLKQTLKQDTVQQNTNIKSFNVNNSKQSSIGSKYEGKSV
ncbi:hypothetical protein WICPIJ_000296 [Wickerhamomyces pijperi]|uniref:Uncharacterized protein n=1 Tax=Wickerhamomyces pijperi TaxID=599730 RepID=A0A9P8TRZ8_WICPI|nr:hypothetical protein WICPIJ_000296 [Wickerhamomyces pijperi]